LPDGTTLIRSPAHLGGKLILPPVYLQTITTLNWFLLPEVKIMPLSPYISFAGNCADAIAYYQKTLGAELLYKINFGEMPKSAQESEEVALQA
jgi:PhnB protein